MMNSTADTQHSNEAHHKPDHQCQMLQDKFSKIPQRTYRHSQNFSYPVPPRAAAPQPSNQPPPNCVHSISDTAVLQF